MLKFINAIVVIVRKKIWLKYSVLIFLFTFLFLFAFKPKSSTGTYCGEYINLSPVGFVLFCDSYQYIYLTTKPSLLLDSNFVAVRQNRPLYIYTAHLIGLPIKLLLNTFMNSSYIDASDTEKFVFQKSINQKLASSPFLKEYQIDDHKNLVTEMLPFYIAFIILNFVILLSALCLFERLLNYLKVEQFLIDFLSLFMVCSGIVKAFFFSAHEQMFAFFTPICIAYIVLRFLSDNFSANKILLITFTMGIFCLAYGSFILYFPSLMFAFFIKQGNLKLSVSLVRKTVLHAILFVIPTFSWIFICNYCSGHYFNGEITTFREIIWIKDALQIGFLHFLYVCLDFTFRYLNTVLITLSPFLIGIYFLRKRLKQKENRIEPQHFYRFTKWMFLLFFCFFWILGYYNFRLTYTCVPILLISISMAVQALLNDGTFEKDKLVSRLKVLSVFWIVWSVLKYGPFPFQ